MVTVRNTPVPDAPAGRALTARSVVASTLLGVTPPELPTRALVATAELLGVAPGTARVALSRMVAAGELAATGDGYRLVGPLLARQARQELSRVGPAARWDGTWRLAVVAGDARPAAERAELRDAMAALRHAELREGVWTRPANLPDRALPDAEALVADRCTWLTARPDEPVDLARRLWDLDAWSSTASAHLAELAVLGRRLADGDPVALADGFVESANVLRHLQSDPLLPADLLPSDWPGEALRAAHRHYDEEFKSTLTTWLRQRTSTQGSAR